MAISFPTSLDNFPNPGPTDLLENATAALDHDVQHSNANDAIEALEAKVGINSSAVTTSHDYKLSGVTGSDKAVSKTGTETLTNKTLTSPVINVTSDATGDIYYRNAGGLFTRLAIGNAGDILNVTGGVPAWIPNPAGSDASTSVKGVVEEATLAETLARTTTGGTSARLFINPGTLPCVLTSDYAVDSVGTDAYAIAPTPAITAYVTGQVFYFKAGTANTGAATLAVSGLTAKAIVKNYNVPLVTGDILAGQVVQVVYESSGDNFQLLSPVAASPVFKNGTTTYDVATASGTQNIAHGMGAIPKKVRLTFVSNNSVVAGANNMGVLVYNGTTKSAAGRGGANGAARDMNGTDIVLYGPTGGSNTEFATGVITMDATNIILTWTKTNSPTGVYDVLWEAEY